ncbi:hypothetical protein [Streptomyces sp. NPDC005773]|uniref:hypothetical protein n=1 Tax=Streptomyces sp. NPDC005773 TaxID=3364727 RepID=UPI0036A4B8AF
MPAQPASPARPERSDREPASVNDLPFTPSLVKAVFRDVTTMHVSRSAAIAAGAVTRTVLSEIIAAARKAAAEEVRKKLLPRDFISAIDRNVELEVGGVWFGYSPTFKGLNGVVHDATGAIVPVPRRSRSRRPSAVAGSHRFEAGVRKLLRSQGVTAVPAMVRDLDGIASAFLTDLARDAVMVVREDGARRFGTVALVMPGEQTSPPLSLLDESLRALSVRSGPRRTVGRDDVMAATRMRLFVNIRQRALAEAREATRNTSAG